MSISELGPYHARSGIDRFLHPRRYGGPNYAAFDVANHFWEWCGGLDDSATPRFERYPTETTRRAWIEALLRARAAATSGDGCGSGVVEPAPSTGSAAPSIFSRRWTTCSGGCGP